jgi:cystathionine beta-lyase
MQKETELISKTWTDRDNLEAVTVNPPSYRGSTVLFDSYADMVAVHNGTYEGIVYGTDRLPTQRQFEESLRELEGGEITRAFQSGIAAIQTALMAFCKSGDHILVCDNAYGPGQHFCRSVLKKFGVDYTLVPPNVGADIEQYIQTNTVLVLLESPGSITFELQDIPAITEITKAKNIVSVLDNTWATPLFLQPLQLGIDICLHSVSKYISGYSDVLAGAATVNTACAEIFDKFYKTMEIYTPAEECYLAFRGLRSLGPRLRQHQHSALTIARWLEAHPLIDTVMHPALESHPEHHIWKRDFKGSSGLFGFTFKKEYSESEIGTFVDALRLFSLGFSWGGYKSLVTAAKIKRKTPCRYENRCIVRLNIGLEACEDLLNDLEHALLLLNN